MPWDWRPRLKLEMQEQFHCLDWDFAPNVPRWSAVVKVSKDKIFQISNASSPSHFLHFHHSHPEEILKFLFKKFFCVKFKNLKINMQKYLKIVLKYFGTKIQIFEIRIKIFLARKLKYLMYQYIFGAKIQILKNQTKYFWRENSNM